MLSPSECTKCHTLKSSVEFYQRRGKCDSWCRACTRDSARTWRANNRAKHSESSKQWRLNNLARHRSTRYKASYGISLSEYNEMLAQQGHACLICEVPQSKLAKRLAVDHCHKTGKVRGLLCKECNQGLGHFKDRAKVILRAYWYLNQ